MNTSVTKIALSPLPPWVRAVAYHHTPESCIPSFRRQLAHFRNHFTPMTLKDLRSFFVAARRGEVPRQGKPGLLITFDDGLSCQSRVAAPLLEEYGFRGIFFVPSDLPFQPSWGHREWCRAHDLFVDNLVEPVGMMPRAIRGIVRRGHKIGCHTATHHRFRSPADQATIDREITGARARLEELTRQVPATFAWVGGEPDTYDPAVQAALRRESFTFAFTTQSGRILPGSDPLILHRTVVDADMPYPLFLAKLHGLSDLSHAAVRRQLDVALARREARP